MKLNQWKLAMFNTKIMSEGKIVCRMTHTEPNSFNQKETNNNAKLIVKCVNNYEEILDASKKVVFMFSGLWLTDEQKQILNKLREAIKDE